MTIELNNTGTILLRAINENGECVLYGSYGSQDLRADELLFYKAHTFKYAARLPRYGKRNFVCTIVPRWKVPFLKLLGVEVYE